MVGNPFFKYAIVSLELYRKDWLSRVIVTWFIKGTEIAFIMKDLEVPLFTCWDI